LRYQNGCTEKIFALQNYELYDKFTIIFEGFSADDKIDFYNYNFITNNYTQIQQNVIGNNQTIEILIDNTTRSLPINAFYINKKPQGTDTRPVYRCTEWSLQVKPNSCILKTSSSSSSSSSNSSSSSSSTSSSSSSSSSRNSSSSVSFYNCDVDKAMQSANCPTPGDNCLNNGCYARSGNGDGLSSIYSDTLGGNVEYFYHYVNRVYPIILSATIKQLTQNIGACKARIRLGQYNSEGQVLLKNLKAWEISEAPVSASQTCLPLASCDGSQQICYDKLTTSMSGVSQIDLSYVIEEVDSCGSSGSNTNFKFIFTVEYINCSEGNSDDSTDIPTQYVFEEGGMTICYTPSSGGLSSVCSFTATSNMGGTVGAWAFFNTKCFNGNTICGDQIQNCGNFILQIQPSNPNWCTQFYNTIESCLPLDCGAEEVFGCVDSTLDATCDSPNPLCKTYLKNHYWKPLQHIHNTSRSGQDGTGLWPGYVTSAACNGMTLYFDWERFLTIGQHTGSIASLLNTGSRGDKNNINWLWENDKILNNGVGGYRPSRALYDYLRNSRQYHETDPDVYKLNSNCSNYSCTPGSFDALSGTFYNFWKDPNFNLTYRIQFDVQYTVTVPTYINTLSLETFPLTFNSLGERELSGVSYANIETNDDYKSNLFVSSSGGECDWDFNWNGFTPFYKKRTINSVCDMGLLIFPINNKIPWLWQYQTFRINPDSIKIIEI
jgi:hypothetical protein